MPVNRHLIRTVAMQSVYEWDFVDAKNRDFNNIVAKNASELIGKDTDKEELSYLYALTDGVLANMDKINKLIVAAAPEWPLEQIALIDKAILRIAIYELVFSNEVPPKVAINEAVELAKTFGGENSSKFVNGVLGTIYRTSDKYKEEDDKPKSESTAEDAA